MQRQSGLLLGKVSIKRLFLFRKKLLEMKKIIVVLFILLGSLQAKASFFYKDIEFLSLENFEVTKGTEMYSISFDYVIKNPNWYSIVIKPSHMNLTIGDTDCGTVFIPEKLKLKRKTTSRYPFVITAEASKFIKTGFGSIWSMLTKGQIDFTLDGFLKAGAMGVKKKIKLDYTYEMTWSEFMSFF